MTFRQVSIYSPIRQLIRSLLTLSPLPQINQDGAGPLEADVDGTSGGTKADAFQKAEVTQDVPGLGIQGLSLVPHHQPALARVRE